MVCSQTRRVVANLVTSASTLYPRHSFVHYRETPEELRYLVLSPLSDTLVGGIIAHCPTGDGVPIQLFVFNRDSVLFESPRISDPTELEREFAAMMSRL